MKLKALLVAAAAAALCVSVASAAPPGKGKHHGRDDDSTQTAPVDRHGKGEKRPGKTATSECRGRKGAVLAGLYVSGSADATGAGTFAMLVKHATGNVKKLGLRGKQVTVTVDAATKVRRHGKATLADLVANDRLVVLARVCPAAATDGAAPAGPTLLAVGVVARPAKAAGQGDDTGTGTTTTTETDTVPKIGTGPALS